MTKCYSFEPTGHRMRPLDIINGVVFRLYCTRCSRVTPTTFDHNIANWDYDSLPTESKVDFMTNPSNILIRKEN